MRMLAERVLNDLHSAKPNASPEGVQDWLANAEPAHPLMTMLVQDADPALRMLVLDAIKNHPTPENREILQKLLMDDDEQVKRQAKDTTYELKALAETPLTALRSLPDE
jgi:HEAT repeat protein